MLPGTLPLGGPRPGHDTRTERPRDTGKLVELLNVFHAIPGWRSLVPVATARSTTTRGGPVWALGQAPRRSPHARKGVEITVWLPFAAKTFVTRARPCWCRIHRGNRLMPPPTNRSK